MQLIAQKNSIERTSNLKPKFVYGCVVDDNDAIFFINWQIHIAG